MADITKIQFCKKIIEQKITKASCDNLSTKDWCEEIALILDNGKKLTITVGQNMGEATLLFDEN